MRWYKEFELKLNERYARLYGEGDYSRKIEKELKTLLLKGAAAVLALLVITGAGFLSELAVYENISTSPGGEILKIKRPSTDEGSISFTARAKVKTDQGVMEKDFFITIEPAGKKEDGQQELLETEKTEQEKAEDELSRLISKINADTSKKQIILPRQLENGDPVTWSKAEKSNIALSLITILILLMLLYKNRFHTVKKEEQLARESVIRRLPEFINEMVLLLNAGVILNTAFLKIINNHQQEEDYFYNRMKQVSKSIKETNAALHLELKRFAKQSGVKELIRIANIISDNISKGTDLSEKLRQENELLWFARKQQAEERGRLAETKLTMPLMILLLVLIMVTVAPALMEM